MFDFRKTFFSFSPSSLVNFTDTIRVTFDWSNSKWSGGLNDKRVSGGFLFLNVRELRIVSRMTIEKSLKHIGMFSEQETYERRETDFFLLKTRRLSEDHDIFLKSVFLEVTEWNGVRYSSVKQLLSFWTA